MTLNGVTALILLYFTEFDSFAGLLRHSGWRYLYCLRNIAFYFWPKLTHPAARSLCDSWATCSHYCVLCCPTKDSEVFQRRR